MLSSSKAWAAAWLLVGCLAAQALADPLKADSGKNKPVVLQLPLSSFVESYSEDAQSSTPSIGLVQDKQVISQVNVKVNNTDTTTDKDKKLTPHSWFVITFSMALLIKGLCMTSTVVAGLSPIPQVKGFYTSGDTGDIDVAPLFTTMTSGTQWSFYGAYAFEVTEKSGFLVLVYSNVLSAILGFVYTMVFWMNCKNPHTMAKLHMYKHIALGVVLVQMCAFVSLPRESSLFFSGLVSSLTSIVGGMSMLVTLPIIVETQCSDTVSRPILISSFVGNILWLICGIMLWDEWICVPNFFSLAANTMVLSLCMYYPQSSSKKDFLVPTKGTWSFSLPYSSKACDKRLPISGADAHDAEDASGYGSMDTCGETGGTGGTGETF